MWKTLWQKWTIDKPAALGDWLWDVFVVQLAALLDAERPDVIWFPAQVPETYSYTLSVALATRLPIVASALGAFPERLAGRPRSWLVPWDASPAQWNAALQAAASGETTFDSAPLVAIS